MSSPGPRHGDHDPRAFTRIAFTAIRAPSHSPTTPGTRQYLSVGNLGANDRVMLFLMDWATARRLNIWGRAEVVEDPALAATLMPQGYDAVPERLIRSHIEAWDLNCNQHIPRRFSQRELAPAVAAYEERIAALEQQLRPRP